MNREKTHIKDKAILLVSFGTSHEDTRRKTIDAIEDRIREYFSGFAIYRAWTSKIIIRILKKEGIAIDNVAKAMERMRNEGIKKLIIQPTHIINGIEYELLCREAAKHSRGFESMVFGAPILSGDEDYDSVVQMFAKIIEEGRYGEKNTKKTAYILMGHGSRHHANSAYAALDYRFKDAGYEDVYVGTVEAYPSIETLIRKLKNAAYQRAVLFPLMIVAGDHAKNDMAGEDEDSWMGRLKKEGIDAVPVLRGMGEYASLWDILIRHIERAGNELS